ncbi:MAG: BolA family protein [Alphaproteobacteria bacterium]
MQVQRTIETKLREAFAPSHLEVLNESHRHAVPPGSESHFKVVVVSEAFAGQPRVRRQQQVNALLADELRNRIHALSMETLTSAEWQAKGERAMQSPDCLGGSRHGRG